MNTALIMIQIVFSVLELPLWIPVQAVCLIVLTVINFKFLLPSLKKIFSVIKK